MLICAKLRTFAGMKLYTVGHSNHEQAEFLRLLQTHGVDCVADVRSVPASKHNPQFNQEALEEFLHGHGIDYQFFGKEFGAQRMDSLNSEGQVDFELAIHTTLFQQGVDRLKAIQNEKKKVALMCSEGDPMACHRFALVARYFHEHGFEVYHILKDGTLVSHQQLEQNMVSHYLHSRKPLLSDVDELFGTYTTAEQLQDAYRLKNKEIGFKVQLCEEYYD